MTKYHARPVIVNGERMDSQAEARKYQELLLWQQAGIIRNLKVHPRYELIPPFECRDGRVRGIWYEADFEYFDEALGETVVLDVKGMQTAVFKLKSKLFRWRYPDVLFVVEAA